MHLVLTARREDRLKDLAAELHTRHGTRCEIIIGDLCNPAEPKRHFDEVQRLGINIELLVNNAGFGFVGTIDDTDPARMMKMVQLNIAALTELTYLYDGSSSPRGVVPSATPEVTYRRSSDLE